MNTNPLEVLRVGIIDYTFLEEGNKVGHIYPAIAICANELEQA